jgi:cytochrome bd-type quinol oxidase subunit 2
MKRYLLLIALAIIGITTALAAPHVLAATARDAVCGGVGLSGGTSGCGSDTGVTDTIRNVIQILSFVVGIAAVIMIVISGLRFVISNGDSQKAANARSSVIYALVGLIVAVLAQTLVIFVFKRA